NREQTTFTDRCSSSSATTFLTPTPGQTTAPRLRCTETSLALRSADPLSKTRRSFLDPMRDCARLPIRSLTARLFPAPWSVPAIFPNATPKPNDPATAKPFANNQIPANRLDPVAMNVINKFVPTANLANNKWQGVIPNPYNTNEFLAKVDHNLTDAQ